VCVCVCELSTLQMNWQLFVVTVTSGKGVFT